MSMTRSIVRTRPSKTARLSQKPELFEIREIPGLEFPKKFVSRSTTKRPLDLSIDVPQEPKVQGTLTEMQAAGIINPQISKMPAQFRQPGAVRGIVNELMKRRKTVGTSQAQVPTRMDDITDILIENKDSGIHSQKAQSEIADVLIGGNF